MFGEELKDVNKAFRLRKVLFKKPNTTDFFVTPDRKHTGTVKRLELLVTAHFPGCIEVTDTEEPYADTPSTIMGDVITSVIDAKKLSWAVKSLKTFKSTYHDGIIPVLVQESFIIILPKA